MQIFITDETPQTDCIDIEIVSNIYKIYKVNNAKSYEYLMSDFKTWSIQLHRSPLDECPQQPLLHSPTEYYFILETAYAKDAFGHWVFEAGIHIPCYLALKQKYPSLKLVLSIPKTFKRLFCDFFGIPQEDIVYCGIEEDIVVYREIQLPSSESNVCFFPSPIVSHNVKELHPHFPVLLNSFFDLFDYTEVPPSCDWLILPRQTKENYKGNDRSVPLLKIINFFEKKKIDHRVLHTDTITDIRQQMDILRSAKNIILTDGAGFYVNSMFVKNKNIINIDIFCKSQNAYNTYPHLRNLYLTIVNKNNNQVQYIETEEDCIQALNAEI
jgi:hypothetical protein